MILHNLDERDGDEGSVISQAANCLDVGEFQVFQLAYEHWHGCEADAKLLDRALFIYLYLDTLPHWARHFARHIISLHEQDKLDSFDPEYHRFDHSYQSDLHFLRIGWRTFWLVVSGIVIFFLLMFYGAHSVIPDWVNCQFPPCYWDEGESPSGP